MSNNVEGTSVEDVGFSVHTPTCSQKVTDRSTSGVTRDADVSATNVDVNDVCSFSSNSSSCCRICQLGSGGSNESLTTSRCLCRGHLGKVHHSCLTEWVRYRGSNRCEICNDTFLDVPPPAVQTINLTQLREHMGDIQISSEQLGYLYYQALDILRTELPQFTLSRRKRTAITGSITFLFLITCVAAILTLGASRDFHKVSTNPWASEDDIRKNHVVFAISLSFSFFCATLTLGLGLLWLLVEGYYYVQRRRIVRYVANRLMQRRQAAAARRSESVVV